MAEGREKKEEESNLRMGEEEDEEKMKERMIREKGEKKISMEVPARERQVHVIPALLSFLCLLFSFLFHLIFFGLFPISLTNFAH